MATRKQIAANRANARKSTGPKTPQGKNRVRYNALTHGLFAQALIPPPLEPYESREDFDRLLQDLRDDLAPVGAAEDMLVETIAACRWRLTRFFRTEAGHIARRQEAVHQDDALGAPLPNPAIARLQAVLDDPPALRRLLAGPGSERESYTGSQLREFAQTAIANLQRRHDEALANWRRLAELESSLPHTDTVQCLSRHVVQTIRDMTRSLRELRELQATRTKRRPPPPTPAGDPPASRGARSP